MMLVYRIWTTTTKVDRFQVRVRGWDGWFLLGFIPLYVRCVAQETTS